MAREDSRSADKEDDAVRTTVIELDTVRIELAVQDEVSLITVLGPYSAGVGREVERVARRCRGSLGLEFRAGSDDLASRRAQSFDPSVLRVLKSIHLQCERNGTGFFLCSPPPKLLDTLKLAGLENAYHIADREGVLSRPAKAASRPSAHPGRRRRASQDPDRARKRIYELNTSLKRTACLEKGLDSAEKCVKKFLPHRPPTARGFEFAFSYESSEKVGGDFFDFIPLDDETLGVAIGDVSGHGIDAALIMGISKKLINIRAQDDRLRSPSEVLKQVNRDMSRDLGPRSFVTALYGELHLTTGGFRFARAGHEPPLLFRGTETEIVVSKGVALGLGIDRYFDSRIEDRELSLEPGQNLLLVTDGLAECRNRKEAIYTRERLQFDCGRLDPAANAEGMLARLLGGIRSFADGRAQEDDMTAILVRRLPAGQPASTAPGAVPSEEPPA